MASLVETEYGIQKVFHDAEDFLPLLGTDFVEFYVGDAKQTAHFYKTAFGFQSYAYAGMETGLKDTTSYAVIQDKIKLIFTSSMDENSDIAKHVAKHGSGVKAVAFWVDDTRKAYDAVISRGAESIMEPTVIKEGDSEIVKAGIKTYGETVHYFIERKNFKGHFLPGFRKWETSYNPTEAGLKYVDHMVGNVGWGEMDKWCKFYGEVLGFTQLVSFDDKDISTEYTALMSKVMTNGNGRIKFPINEPAEGKKRSQIEEYLDFYKGSGVQHIAVATDDICATIDRLLAGGVEFLYVPENYYDDLLDRVGEIDEDVEELKKRGILVDRDEEGYLLQLFTKPVGDRPTLFFEIIERKGAQSFGKGNFKALFEAIEREQENRGTL